jgi:hypothetical protein
VCSIDPPQAFPWCSTRCASQGLLAAIAAGVLASGCAAPPAPPAAPAPQVTRVEAASPVRAAPAPQPRRAAASTRNWEEYRLQVARRIVEANPQLTYGGAVSEPLLAIPVLEVELNSDGSIRAIDVLRQPSQARDTTQLAIDAVRRAGPFDSVAHLPRPWKFAEAFLFNDDRRFKPRSLDVR